MDLNAGARRTELFGLPIDIGLEKADVVRSLSSGCMTLTYLNPLAWHIRTVFPAYASNLVRFDHVVCDGLGVQRAVRRVHGVRTSVLTPDFSGIARDYLEYGAERGWSLCLVGGREGIAEKAREAVGSRFAGYAAISAFAGYGNSPGEAMKTLRADGTDMVLVGLGMGRQEAWLSELVAHGWRGVGICVGGFLDKLANPELDYPAWSQRIGMRFLGRIAQEPARMSRRYLVDYQPFVRQYLRHLLTGGR